MLRRKPTALTISPEDLAAFETHHARQQAYLHYRRTGEDPQGLFTSLRRDHQTQSQQQRGGVGSEFEYHAGGNGGDSPAGDPSDELKPLPGDKARIVRSREERIVGASLAGGGGGGRGAN